MLQLRPDAAKNKLTHIFIKGTEFHYSGRYSFRDYNNGNQFLTYRKTPFSAMSPLSTGSDYVVLPSFKLTILGRTPVTVWLFNFVGNQ